MSTQKEQYEKLLPRNNGEEANPEGELVLLIVKLYDEKAYYKLYEAEIKTHKYLAMVPPKWVYWRYLRGRCGWGCILCFYIAMVLWAAIAAMVGFSAFTSPTIYTIAGEGCGDSVYFGTNQSYEQSFDPYTTVNGTFDYYVQGYVGLCVDSDPQGYHSPECLEWTDHTFWENFEEVIDTDDYTANDCSNCHGQAATDADNNSKIPSYKLMYFTAVVSAVSRPVEALMSFLTRGKQIPIFKSNWFYLLRSLAILAFNLILTVQYGMAGLVGDEDVDATINVDNWQKFYGCESVTRTSWPVLASITFSAVSLILQITFVSLPESLNYLKLTCCCSDE